MRFSTCGCPEIGEESELQRDEEEDNAATKPTEFPAEHTRRVVVLQGVVFVKLDAFDHVVETTDIAGGVVFAGDVSP